MMRSSCSPNASPAQLLQGGAAAAARADAAAGEGRLEQVLSLLIAHEHLYREQDLRLAEAAQRTADLEARLASELAPLSGLKERNVLLELELARTAVESLVRQLAAASRAHAELKAELKAQQQRQQQQQAAHEQQLAVLTAELAALRSRLDDVADGGRSAVDALRTSMRLQAEQQRAEAEEGLQSMQRELASQMSQLRHEASRQAASAARELEAWTKAELVQMAGQLKTVVAGATGHQQQVNLQMEALQQQWEATSEAMSAQQQEQRRLKKHVARLQQQTEELPQLSQAVQLAQDAADSAHGELQQLGGTQRELAVRVEAAAGTLSDVAARLQETSVLLAQLDEGQLTQAAGLGHLTHELAQLADCVGGCMAAARVQPAAVPTGSYLSSLLGPAAPPAAGACSSNQQLTAWDGQLNALQARLQRRLQASALPGQLPGVCGAQPAAAERASPTKRMLLAASLGALAQRR